MWPLIRILSVSIRLQLNDAHLNINLNWTKFLTFKWLNELEFDWTEWKGKCIYNIDLLMRKEHLNAYRTTFLPNKNNDKKLGILCWLWWIWNMTSCDDDNTHASDWCWLCWRETETPLILTAIGSLMKCIRTGTGGLFMSSCVLSSGWYCEKTETEGGRRGCFRLEGASSVLRWKCLKAKFLTLSWNR